jgi:hypothetical protein
MAVPALAGTGRAAHGLGMLAEKFQPPLKSLIEMPGIIDVLAIDPLR